tara:strand:- start:702 stop:1427 length:726 start_codon:yes stop_codon:yes gene_type:complete
MGYFRELPDILYPSPLLHKKSTGDYIQIVNIFRRTKLFDYISDSATLFNKYVIEDGERPDTIADIIYGNPKFDFVIILVAGITNITHEWPLQNFQMYDVALNKYGSEEKMNEIHHYETFEIRDTEKNRQILPPNLIVDKDFRIDGSSLRHGSNRFTLISESGNIQLDDKFEYTVLTDKIAKSVTNFQFEIEENEKKREIDVLKSGFLQTFVNDLRDVSRYSRSSSFITSKLAQTEINNLTN